MVQEDIETLKERRICCDCVGEEFLSNEIFKKGESGECFYCGDIGQSYSIEEISERVETAFDEHYSRTPADPDTYESMMLADRESSYVWYREGQETAEAIAEAALIPEDAASDIQRVLDDKCSDFDAAAMGEETEFAADAQYDQKGTSDAQWQQEWFEFERSLKTRARFFSRSAARHLTSVFEGVDSLQTRDGKSLIVNAGPGTELPALFRARVFQSDTKLSAALARPDRQLGTPPSVDATAGRMNARGISVFYGANDPLVALAEVRPPVGSRVAVARFEIIRALRLLDLTALSDVTVSGSIFDPTLKGRLERTMFLRSLSKRIVMPVMPDDEPFEYLATQAIADFLATENDPQLDGIIFPSVQAAGEALNIVLFNKAAEIAEIELPHGTKIEARLGMSSEEGWETDYAVTEEVSPPKPVVDPDQVPPHPFEHLVQMPDLSADFGDFGDFGVWPVNPTLKIDLASIRVHHVQAVQYRTYDYEVRRHRWERHKPDF